MLSEQNCTTFPNTLEEDRPSDCRRTLDVATPWEGASNNLVSELDQTAA